MGCLLALVSDLVGVRVLSAVNAGLDDMSAILLASALVHPSCTLEVLILRANGKSMPAFSSSDSLDPAGHVARALLPTALSAMALAALASALHANPRLALRIIDMYGVTTAKLRGFILPSGIKLRAREQGRNAIRCSPVSVLEAEWLRVDGCAPTIALGFAVCGASDENAMHAGGGEAV